MLRPPVLCLDTNASIDFGAILSIDDGRDALAAQFENLNKAWEGVQYDEHAKSNVLSKLKARHKQLSAAQQFLRFAVGHADMRLPKFAKLEHVRIQGDTQALPPYSVLVDPRDALDLALEVFRKTKLGLQDAMILASAAMMGADALVSNDDDFKRAFNAGAGTLVWELAGKALALLDHRNPLQAGATLHSTIVQSLKQRYGKTPWFGEPTHVDRRDGAWYLAYRHPLPVEGAKPALVPGQHHLSVMDAHSLVVCEVREMYFFDDSLPNGVTSDLVARLASVYADQKSLDRHLRRPKGRDPGDIELAIPLTELPEQWQRWTAAKGARPHKKLAPKSAVAFVERPR